MNKLPEKHVIIRAIAFCTALAIALPLLLSFTSPDKTPGTHCRALVLDNMERVVVALNNSRQIIASGGNAAERRGQLQNAYRQARRHYKEIEFFIEYYSPFEAKYYINGPLVPKVDPEISSEPFPPMGFQVMEELIFDKGDLDTDALLQEIAQLKARLETLKDYYATLEIEEDKLLEALGLQFIRIMCLTLNGYDCTINKEALPETVFALGGIEKTVLSYQSIPEKWKKAGSAAHQLEKLIKKCKRKLERHPDSDSFDRLGFIVNCLDPAYAAMLNFRNALGAGHSPINYAVNMEVPSFLEPNSIRKQYFSLYQSDESNMAAQAELGSLLFYDPILSGNNKRACASCHKAEKAFTDGEDKSLAYDGIHKVDRNAPTLLNAAYQKLFFHDGRAFNLEHQADGVFNNTFEMQSSGSEMVTKLRQSHEYRYLFSKAFVNSQDSAITFYAIVKSISEFIKTLDSRNSRFDQHLRGQAKLGREEAKGFNLFMGKALCGSCHFFPLFNGTVPPMYTDNEFEVLGVPEKENGQSPDPDEGRKKITRAEVQRFAFKTPTVRNSALTAPYMHNGAYKNLDSVLAFYNRGGGAGSGMKLENQTLPFDSLGLQKRELRQIKLFLLSLTDTSALPKPPKKLPACGDKVLDARRVGGEY